MLGTALRAQLQLWGCTCPHHVPVRLQRAQKDTVSAATDTLGLLFFELLFLVRLMGGALLLCMGFCQTAWLSHRHA